MSAQFIYIYFQDRIIGAGEVASDAIVRGKPIYGLHNKVALETFHSLVSSQPCVVNVRIHQAIHQRHIIRIRAMAQWHSASDNSNDNRSREYRPGKGRKETKQSGDITT